VTTDFDRPRAVPDELTARWKAERYWSGVTVSDAIDSQVDSSAIAWVIDGKRHTFGALCGRSKALAAVLREHGVGRGDRVLIQLPNCVELLSSIHAAWRLGAVAVPVLPMFREHELRSVVHQIHPAAVVAADAHGTRSVTAEIDAALSAESVRPNARLVAGATDIGWSALPGEGSGLDDGFAPAGFRSADACALVLFTSGTTAQPKGVRHDSQSLLAEVDSYRRSASLTVDDVIFNPAPVPHIGALVISVLLPWCLGVPVVLQSQWDSTAALEVITRERATFAVGAPFFLQEMVSRYEVAGDGGHRLGKFQTGAAPTPAELLTRAHRVGIAAWRAWGMTEAPTLSYGSAADSIERRAHFDGRIETGTEVVAVDEQGVALPPGSEGQLRIRSPKQMMGYVDPVAGAAHDDGWLETGDLGTIDAEGWITITGRTKDIINRGGEKFSARDVENALCAHPSIDYAAVIGVPEPRLGEQVVAYVTVRDGHGDPGFDAIIDHLDRLRLAAQKRPVTITVLDALPLTATGKVQKPALVKLWAATRGQQDARST
jgi:acyl-CoA synthetase (AMP-forming)/AMP-acid ligase II